ncbi:DMT family transporter [Acinetobacter rudis]|uniref:DMT family transporter n=1 Tax=Acinetobacter rudis TaxID=632955 RepID=A0AAW8J5B9_9GAMM|nr:DMT family transporter [Acinetobacter rudis]MDQ8934853.1 DMT family transporter [Acinetobacter rudis]MDQ8953126.1 DMT family transporter [Acinetobacter rudis]MDQ9017254.1 DMT family transporter [Acinetobacter rudis]
MNEATKGWVNGLIGVTIFAGSLPATRVAVADFDPLFLTAIRALIAALLGVFLLIVLKQPKPKLTDLPSLAMSALGVVIGFPLLTALALQYVTSAHSIVFIGLLPLCTALFAVLRAGERPKPLFWVFSILGAAFVAGYSAFGSSGASLKGDLLMLAAVLVCGFGYAEGARVSRTLGGWQVICWALLLSLPIMLPIALWDMPSSFSHVSLSAWFALAYVSIFSMFLGFVFWYKGLVQGGIAAVGQLQLFQPFIGLTLAAVLLHESVSWTMLVITLIAVLCVAGSKKYA